MTSLLSFIRSIILWVSSFPWTRSLCILLVQTTKDTDKTEKRDPVPCRLPPDPLNSAGAGDEEMGVRPEDQIIISAQIGEMVNTYDNAREEDDLALELVKDDIEMGISQPNLQVKNGPSSTATTSEDRNHLEFDLKMSVLLITISMIPLIDTLCLHGPAAKLDTTIKLSAFFAFTAFLSSVSLLFHTLKLMVRSTRVTSNNGLLSTSRVLFAIAATSLFLTCISITYSLVPKAYYFLPLALLPSVLVAGFHLFYRVETEQHLLEINSAQRKAVKKELKRATQLTLSLVSMSFSGFIGVLLAIYHKEASLGAAYYSHVKVCIYLLLGGGVAGMLALLLCRLLLFSNDEAERRLLLAWQWQRAILSTANIVMLTMLVSAVMIIAGTILHGLLVATAFPVLAGASAWLVVELYTDETEDGNKQAAGHIVGTMYAIAVAVASISFGAILAIFAEILTGAVSREQLKACTFLLASSFVASASLGTVTSRTAQADKTNKASTEFAAAVLVCCSVGTLVLAALTISYQIQA